MDKGGVKVDFHLVTKLFSGNTKAGKKSKNYNCKYLKNVKSLTDNSITY